ncbi:MAG: YigZ family protein [Leeuwenhoekiella sp.]
MNIPKSHLTLNTAVENVQLKERGSKFISYAFPVKTEAAANDVLAHLWRQHPKATHICYAWQLGENKDRYRANDDGEPANSAGIPIYGQLQSYNLTFVLLAVVRYYGGLKLGVGGLIKAYREAADLALAQAKIVEVLQMSTLILEFEYDQLSPVMSLISEMNLNISSQNMQLSCEIKIEAPPDQAIEFKNRMAAIQNVQLRII